MKSRTVKYIIKVTPTFSQRFGFGVLSMIGGTIGGLASIYILGKVALDYANKKKEDKVKNFKEFADRVKKEESDKE